MKTTTLVLVGKTGNGKSATGNSILGSKEFESKASSKSVTQVTMSSVRTVNDRVVEVIDTPGLFDEKLDPSAVKKEIAKCIVIAKNGIDGILIVVSLRNRFSKEESLVLQTLEGLFGENITKYAVVVFTNADACDEDEDEVTFLNRYISESPPTLQQLLARCKRYVLFNNRTRDREVKAKQVSKLLELIDSVVEQNGGRPYSSDLFKEAKKGAEKRKKMNEKESEAKLINEIEKKLEKKMEEMKEEIKEEMKGGDNSCGKCMIM